MNLSKIQNSAFIILNSALSQITNTMQKCSTNLKPMVGLGADTTVFGILVQMKQNLKRIILRLSSQRNITNLRNLSDRNFLNVLSALISGRKNIFRMNRTMNLYRKKSNLLNLMTIKRKYMSF